MTSGALIEVFNITNDRELSETGGGHAQKGFEYQKNWSLLRMFSLVEEGSEDFLFLFEAIQDVSILNSSSNPTKIEVTQIKKRERIEWEWNTLTLLHKPPEPGKTSRRAPKALEAVRGSLVGKLHSSLRAITSMESSGRFISNAGCNLILSDGSNAATSMPVSLASLSDDHREILESALKTMHGADDHPPDLSRIFVEKIDLPVDDPITYTTGKAHAFLLSRSPKHAGQARALVDALLAKIGPLGARTKTCKSYEELRTQRGYSRHEFMDALRKLQDIPDVSHFSEVWLSQLQSEGMAFTRVLNIKTSVASIYNRQVMGTRLDGEDAIIAECDLWLSTKDHPAELLPYFGEAAQYLEARFPDTKISDLQAHFLLRAIQRCADLN